MAVKHVLAAGDDAYYAWDVTMASRSSLYGRVYVWFDAFPKSGLTRLVRGMSQGQLAFAVDVLANGKIRAVDSKNGKLFSSAQSVATGRWVRIEWSANFATGVVQVRIFNDATSSTPTETKTSQTSRPIGTQVDAVQFGRSGHQDVAATFWTDRPALSAAGYPSIT